MSTVTAYAATSATEPLAKTTINRRDVGPHDVKFDIQFAGICHSDIHTVRGRVGSPRLSRSCRGTRSPASSRRSARRSRSTGSATASASAASSTPAASAGTARPAWSSTARAAEMVGTYNGDRPGRPADLRRLQPGSIVVNENYVLRIPDALGLDAAAPLLCAASRLTRRCGTGCRARQADRRRRPRRPGHMAVKLAARDGRGGHRADRRALKKMEDGLRLGADHYYATADPETFKKLRRDASISSSTPSRPSWTWAGTSGC